MVVSSTIKRAYFHPKYRDARLSAIAVGRSLSKVLDHTELLTKEDRTYLDHAMSALAECVWGLDRLLGKEPGA